MRQASCVAAYCTLLPACLLPCRPNALPQPAPMQAAWACRSTSMQALERHLLLTPLLRTVAQD